jgi:hypothetical protein
MLGIEALNMMFAAGFGALLGGAMCVIAHKQTHKFHMRMMEDYWNSDIKRIQSHVDALESKLSTFSGDNDVIKAQKSNPGKGFNWPRHFKQGD